VEPEGKGGQVKGIGRGVRAGSEFVVDRGGGINIKREGGRNQQKNEKGGREPEKKHQCVMVTDGGNIPQKSSLGGKRILKKKGHAKEKGGTGP